jgi:LysM repeat protein
MADETIRLKADGKPSANSEKMPQHASIHYVKPGETLFGISQKYGVSVEAIKEQNRLQTNALWAGQKLKLP